MPRTANRNKSGLWRQRFLCKGWLGAAFLGATVVLASSTALHAQTPWQASPAAPAALPPANVASDTSAPPATPTQQTTLPSASVQTQVKSLPPPPSGARPATPRKTEQQTLSIPDHIPLTPVAKPQSTLPNFLPGQLPTSQQLTPPALPNLTQLPSSLPSTLPSATSPAPTGRVAGTLVSARPAPGTAPVAGAKQERALMAQAELLPSGKLIAVVGGEHILAGDMSVFVEPIIMDNKDRIRTPAEEAKVRAQLTRQILTQYIAIKAMYLEFFRDAAGVKPPAELEKVRDTIIPKASQAFFSTRVPQLVEQYDATGIADLERKLTSKGLSLSVMRRQFIETALSMEYERKYTPQKFEVEREELLEYYRAHRDEWNIPAGAKWRQISLLFSNHAPETARTQAGNLLEQMRLGGKQFAAVAKQSSEGLTAEEGGLFEWTTLGSLRSKTLEQAIFTYPLNRLSGVIEDETGCHIIEVLDRKDAHVKDFATAQPEIREILENEKSTHKREELRKQVLARTTVWTLWPEDLADLPNVRPLEDALR